MTIHNLDSINLDFELEMFSFKIMFQTVRKRKSGPGRFLPVTLRSCRPYIQAGYQNEKTKFHHKIKLFIFVLLRRMFCLKNILFSMAP